MKSRAESRLRGSLMAIAMFAVLVILLAVRAVDRVRELARSVTDSDLACAGLREQLDVRDEQLRGALEQIEASTVGPDDGPPAA
jgi:hypothetical protein